LGFLLPRIEVGKGTERLGRPFGLVFRLMLLTAQRESEVAGMAWSELDLDGRTWTIPGARAKKGKPNIVHLNGLAIEVLGQVHRIVDQDLLFSGNGRTAVTGFSSAKTWLDAAMGGMAGVGNAKPSGSGGRATQSGTFQVSFGSSNGVCDLGGLCASPRRRSASA
jgi:integrase